MKTVDRTNTPAGFYIPGHARAKVVMILLGFLLAAWGVWQIHTPLRLLLFGERAEAVATAVIKTKPGLADLVLENDAQVQANLEARDRSYVFWNEFRFQTPDDRTVTVWATIGSELKPLYPLLDADGLPTTDLVCYDAHDPKIVVFPWSVSTWFAPGMMIFIGMVAMIIGCVLLAWAEKPIALPHLPPAPRADV